MRENGKKTEEKINDALLKVALGYQVAEVTEEYAEVDGELKLTKRKKTKKDVPPDLKAVQMLLAVDGDEGYSDWSDEDLEREKQRLIERLQEGEVAKAEEKKVSIKKTSTRKTASKKGTGKKTAKKTSRKAKTAAKAKGKTAGVKTEK